MSTTKSKWLKRATRVLAAVGALWLSWTLYALIAPEAEDKVPESISVDHLSPDPTLTAQPRSDLLKLLESVLHSPVTSGNKVTPLINGNQIFPAMIDAIDRAEHAVYLLTYVYWSGQIADEFATALGKAVQRGVKVRLILDAYGARKIPDVLLQRMEADGIIVAWFHPFELYNVRHFNLRTHRKVMVVDGTVAFTGGVGIADEWQGDARDSSEWRDDHFRIEGPAVDLLTGSFIENWLNATGELLNVEVYKIAQRKTSDRAQSDNTQADDKSTRLLVLSTSPRGDMSPISFSYWTALQLATKSVNIATPYFVPDANLAKALMETAERGVIVNLLLPGDINDSTLVRYASFAFYDNLINSGVAVYEYQRTMMHTKSIVVDERWSLFGSPNFDNRSFELNDEILVVADDASLAARLNESFMADISHSRQIRLEQTDFRYWVRQVLAHLALFLREQI
ncbi:MAG: cardiolipin synthase B [Granulosicoccus sp.]|nr:cardiolipin synthase B [Granulosicoccus sp.]